jgi:hypothetical protein
MALPEFKPFGKIARLSRGMVVTEKIDGTNAQVYVSEEGEVFAGSRTRWITPQADNYGFAAWVEAHRQELLALGPGQHFGEWWGQGIQRRYGLTEKRFSLFNVGRWGPSAPVQPPDCCHVVPVLYTGDFSIAEVEGRLAALRAGGSIAAPGFMQPEGVVVYHVASRTLYKKTIDRDDQPKGEREDDR